MESDMLTAPTRTLLPLIARGRSLAVRLSAIVLVAMLSPGMAIAEDAMPASDETPLEPIVVGTPERIEVFPTSFKLDTVRRRLHPIVTGYYADGKVQDLTRAAEIVAENPEFVRIEEGVVTPVADGVTKLIVRVGGHEAAIPIEVSHQQSPDPVSFQYGALVALSKQDCNSGACHGSPSGKGGFRLSLRAYDPVLDTLTLVRESANRRTNVEEPEASLLLRKPLMEVAGG